MGIAALQDERNFGIEGTWIAGCRAGRVLRRDGGLSGMGGCSRFGTGEPRFQRLDACFVIGFHFLDFGAQGGEVGIVGMGRTGGRQRGRQEGGT